MAVYTQVSDTELRQFLHQYKLGGVRTFKGIAEGTENSNFLLETTCGSYILTLFEKRVRHQDLPYFLNITKHLALAGFPAAKPIADTQGQVLKTLNHRPATICTFLQGISMDAPDTNACAAIGAGLANMHLALDDFPLRRDNDLSVTAWPKLFNGLETTADTLEEGLSRRIAADLTQLASAWPGNLPVGTIHADLFPDNALFVDDQLSGLIDFYFACTDMLAYDIAVCLTSWCFSHDGTAFDTVKAHALVNGYNNTRPLNASEIASMPILARGAAMRFFLTRLIDHAQNDQHNASDTLRNPLDYARRLDFHRSRTSLNALSPSQ